MLYFHVYLAIIHDLELNSVILTRQSALSMICAEVLYDRLPRSFMLQRVFINDTEIVSHTKR